MASSSQQRKPAEYAGYGQDPSKPQGGLLDKSFDSRCPPVVTPNTTIIAVCGPNDYDDNANPQRDGWFFSDFYLFHHLFRHTAQKQYWLTCVSPKDLVEKYKELVYGDGDARTENRRIVLDASFAKEVEDVIVFQPHDLLENFLSYITNTCEDLRGTDAPILILIFGYKKSTHFAITIGGAGDFDSCPVLYQSKLKEAIFCRNPDPNVTLLTTACYGGGWTQTPFMNITAMAGVETTHERYPWPEGASLIRCCGSRYASEVARAFICSEIQNLDEDSEQDIRQSSTYKDLVATIHDILFHEIDVREDNSISFSAKDDQWGMELRARTGFPLTTYLEKWKSLRIVPQGASNDQSFSASIRFSDTVRLGIPEAEFLLKRLAIEYLKSKPGDDSAAKNHVVHSLCHRLLLGKTMLGEDLERLAGALQYRLTKIVARATDFKDRLDIPFPDCHDFDLNSHHAKRRYDFATENMHDEIGVMLLQSELFDDCAEHEYMPYYKGEAYLAIVLTESGWSRKRIEGALSELVRVKRETSAIEATLREFRFWEVPELRDMLGTLAKSFNKSLRHRSPVE